MVKNSKFEFFLKTFFNESGDVKNIEIFLDKLSEETLYISVKDKKKFLSLESKIGRKSFIKAKELIQKLSLWKLSLEKAKKNSLIKSIKSGIGPNGNPFPYDTFLLITKDGHDPYGISDLLKKYQKINQDKEQK